MNNLEIARCKMNLTQKQLCEMAGISLKAYHRYVHENKAIPSDKLLRLSEALNITTDFLLGKTKYTLITVTDKEGVPIALISNERIVEKRDYKVFLT